MKAMMILFILFAGFSYSIKSHASKYDVHNVAMSSYDSEENYIYTNIKLNNKVLFELHSVFYNDVLLYVEVYNMSEDGFEHTLSIPYSQSGYHKILIPTTSDMIEVEYNDNVITVNEEGK